MQTTKLRALDIDLAEAVLEELDVCMSKIIERLSELPDKEEIGDLNVLNCIIGLGLQLLRNNVEEEVFREFITELYLHHTKNLASN